MFSQVQYLKEWTSHTLFLKKILENATDPTKTKVHIRKEEEQEHKAETPAEDRGTGGLRGDGSSRASVVPKV